jgi:branched-chain amino acid transport system ATP-binding protein/urea transport system ATP-binding protein
VLEDVRAAVEIADFLACAHRCARTGGREEGGNAGATGAQFLCERALGCQLHFEFAGQQCCLSASRDASKLRKNASRGRLPEVGEGLYKIQAIDGVDFRLEDGELRCLIGPNGAGKSTFFKMLTGQYQPTAGTIRFREHDIAGLSAHRIGQLGIGIKNQVPDVMDGLTVEENLWLAARFVYSGEEAREMIDQVVERLDIRHLTGHLVGELAHGQRQWVEIGMIIAREPILMLLDEPSAGMGAEETARTAALIRELNRTATIIVVEHDMQFIRRIARTVTVFHQGRILVEAPVEEVMADARVRDVYLGRQGA